MLKATCNHCGKEKEYTIGGFKEISQEFNEVNGKIVCKSCYAIYLVIEKQVKEFAEKKKQELEEAFFSNLNEIDSKLNDLV